MRPAFVAAVVLSLSGCSAEWDGVKGQYPAAVTTYDGLTAAGWGEKARDANPYTVRRAAAALHALGAEGVPYLIGATEHHAGAGRFAQADCCLSAVDGSLLDRGDVEWLVRYLDKEKLPGGAESLAVLRSALVVTGQARSKGRPLAYWVRKLTNDNDPQVGAAARDALAAIDK